MQAIREHMDGYIAASNAIALEVFYPDGTRDVFGYDASDRDRAERFAERESVMGATVKLWVRGEQ